MLTYQDIDSEKDVFIFELDDVLFPKQDYLLQVYYLFANLLEYTELSPTANELTEFFKQTYLEEGEAELFQRAREKFNINEKYKESFMRLHVNARLPLKLLLYKSVLTLLTAMRDSGKSIFILTKGNPLVQLNKIRQTEWNSLDQYLKVYFYDEIKIKSDIEPLAYVLAENGISAKKALFFGASSESKAVTDAPDVDHVSIKLFLDKVDR